MFNFNHLYYFYLTAKLSGVTKAAAALRVAQPSLSAQLRVLEQQLGFKLFQKSGRKLELTSQGYQAYEYCRRMFEIAEDYSHVLKTSNATSLARIRIGVSDEIDRPFIVDCVSKLIKKSKNGNVPLLAMNSNRDAALVEDLRSNEIDALISICPVYDSDLSLVCEVKMPVVLSCSSLLLEGLPEVINHPMDLTTDLATLVNILPKRWVMPHLRLKLRGETEAVLGQNQIHVKTVFEGDVLGAVVRAICDGTGIGLIPLPYISKEVRQGTVKIFGPTNGYFRQSVWLITQKRNVDLPWIANLKKVLEKFSIVLEPVPQTPRAV